ncbi:MAG: peptidase domain-containing ABC transporter [Burkholderiales bacterium]|nr:peptidase domain-containing ABC transporter [Burkholderiales bacterium]
MKFADITHELHFGFGAKLPTVLQTEAAECGLACLAMIASYHGHQIDLPTLRRKFSVSLKGATLAHLVGFANVLGMASRPLRLEPDHLSQLKLPCILHWDMNHFVVLKSVSDTQIVIHDPAVGVRKMAREVFSRHFTGIAVELTPSASFKRQEERQYVSLRSLMGGVVGLKRSLAQIFLIALALEVFALIAPFFMQWVVDGVLVSGDRDLLTTLVIGFGLLIVIQQAVGALRSWVVLYLSTTLNLQWLANVFRHLLQLPVTYFEKRYMGDVVSRFDSINVIQRALTTSFVEGIIDGIMSVVMLSMMLFYSLSLSTIVLAAVLTYGLIRILAYAPLRQATEEQIVAASKQQSHFLESVRGIQTIKLFNRQDERGTRWQNLVVDNINRTVRTQRLALMYKTFNGLLFGLQGVLVVWLGAKLVLDKTFSVGMLFAFVAYKDQFTQRVGSLIDRVFDLHMLRLQGERLADIVYSEPEQIEPSALERDPSSAVPADVELRNLSFRYADNEPLVLQDINLRIEAGESVAIVGPSGCGKTTLAKVLLGLLPPHSGEVLVGDARLSQIGMTAYRDMVGTVMQEDQLFAGSIADNIAFFDPQADMARIEDCARLAAIHDEITSMPMRYNTLIGDMGTTLSGGQKQRIFLARALYKQPRILVLDEATSALDIQNEKQVNSAIQQLKLTRIVIAHRPETINTADRVISMHGGQIKSDLRKLTSDSPGSLSGSSPQVA